MVEVMRWWCIVIALVACNKRQEVPAGQGSALAPVAAPADAEVVDMAAPAPAVDAAPTGPAPIDTDRLLDVETVGPLRFRMTEAQSVKLLGAPKQKTLPVEEGATGEFASTWTWPGVTLEMVSDTRTGPAKVRLIVVTAPVTPEAYATQRGIKIGSTRREVAAAYPKSDEGGDDPTQFLVGSPFGGLLFVLKGDVVAEIILGPMAF